MKVGWIGTGIMGLPMCAHIIDGGHDVYVFNRTKKNALDLIEKGATWCDNPKQVAQFSEIIFIMVGTPKDVSEVLFETKGVFAGAMLGTTVVDMTTSSPELAKKNYQEACINGIFSLDAPVSGGDIGARDSTLAIMVGGDKNVYEKNFHLFKLLGSNIEYMGGAGTGQHTKMANQILVAGTMIGVVESLLYAQNMGMNINKVIDVIGKGAASSWAINVLGRKIAFGNFEPGFFIKHFVKDMGIALAEAERVNLCLPGLALIRQFYISAVAMGYENLGTHGLYKVLDRMNMSLQS